MTFTINGSTVKIRQTGWIKFEDGTYDFEASVLDAWGDAVYTCEVNATDEHDAAVKAVGMWKERGNPS